MIVEYTLYINFTNNNIITTLVKTFLEHKICTTKIIATSSSGSCGFKNIQKKTPFACITVLSNIAEKLKSFKIKILSIVFKGESNLYKLSIDTLLKHKNIKITKLVENTTYAYNGCKPPKNIKLILNDKLI